MENKTDLNKLLLTLSLAMDFSRAGLMRHHQRVALISLRIGELLGLSGERKQRLFQAAVVHDAGVSTWREKAGLEVFEIESPWDHCSRGKLLFTGLDGLIPISDIIFSHHDRWEGDNPSGLSGEFIPLESRIIHLADRVDVLAGGAVDILEQRGGIVSRIKNQSGKLFDPLLVSVLEEISERESFWFDLSPHFIQSHLEGEVAGYYAVMEAQDLLSLGSIFARIIDGKSPFTYRHSRMVSEVAGMLAEEMGFSREGYEMMLLAGLLHDLGKLSVPESILEKPGSLSVSEFNIIKQHTYYTYHILDKIRGFEEIKEWAAFHHEKLNGNGYPFHLKGEQIPRGARIMAVADIYSALAEDRPYRPGLPAGKIEEILWREVEKGHIDGGVVDVLIKNIDRAKDINERLKDSELIAEKMAPDNF